MPIRFCPAPEQPEEGRRHDSLVHSVYRSAPLLVWGLLRSMSSSFELSGAVVGPWTRLRDMCISSPSAVWDTLRDSPHATECCLDRGSALVPKCWDALTAFVVMSVMSRDVYMQAPGDAS